MTVLLAMTSARADAVVPEPVEALVANHSVARRGDGTVLLLMPPGQLLVSRDAHPLTLENFAEPVTLFGESGILANRRPDSAAIAAEGDAVHVIFTINHRLNWYSSSGPLGADTKWERHTAELPVAAHVQDVVTSGKGVHAIYIETDAQAPQWRLNAATLQDGKIRSMPVAESSEVLSSARGTSSKDGSIEIVWTRSELAPRVGYARLNTSSGEVSGSRMIHDGMHPDIVSVGGRTFIASEQTDGTIRSEWHGPHGLEQVQTLRGRAGYRPALTADEHGVAWLFAVGRDQRGLFYRRFLGSGFGAEAECGAAPGAWKLSLGFDVQPFVGDSDDGFAILHGEYLEGGNEGYRYRFGTIPVPRYAARDPRHVLFLDMLEVAEIENLKQQVTTAVRSEANPMNLNGPPGSPDAGVAGYATVLPEDGKFRMWYNGESDTPGRDWVICYAESKDGIHWTKPELGLVKHQGSTKNNLLFPTEYGTNTPLVIKDESESDPARRYKMVFESKYEGATGVYLNWSADGVHWQWPPHRLWGKSAGRNKTTRGFNPWHEPLSSFFRDPLASHPDYLWKIYGQDIYAGHPHFDPNKARNLGLVHGATPYEFTGYVDNPVLEPRTGHNEDQIHGGLVQPYEGLYVSLYQHWWGEDWTVDLRLAVSRDGLHFVRVQPETAVLPLGHAGSWDSGMLCTPNFFFALDGKLWLYYRGSVGTLATGRIISETKNSPHLQHSDPWRMMTGLARLRVDGFAYLTPGGMEPLAQPFRYIEVPKYRMPTLGRVKTIPIDAQGIDQRTLHLNMENFAPGFAWVKAQLRDADSGEVIAGYGFDECDPVSKPSLDHRVTWNGSADLSNVEAQRVHVEFQLMGTLNSPQLYSFWFEEGSE